MSDFKRSPSKVWWASESVEWREVSESPGSQDSGFSDSETSPQLLQIQQQNQQKSPQGNTTPKNIAKDILKSSPSEEKPQNLSVNYKEKTTPEKCPVINEQFTPQSARRSRYLKNSPKISRNLFNLSGRSAKDAPDSSPQQQPNQYSRPATDNNTTRYTNSSSSSCETTLSNSYSCDPPLGVTCETTPKSSRTLPELLISRSPENFRVLNRTAPAVLQTADEEEELLAFNGNHSLSSDCESELECLFNGPVESPKHTSTPKSALPDKMRYRKNKIPLNLYLKYQQERVCLPSFDGVENGSVKLWMKETRQAYEPECMTTLQCKSIALELNQKVSYLAAVATSNIRSALTHFQYIELEYKKLNSERTYVGPLVQSLAGNIVDFIKTFTNNLDQEVLEQYNNLREATGDDVLKLMTQLFNHWQTVYQEVLIDEAKQLIDKLENPRSELELRAYITGITSVALRNENLIEIFTKNDIVPILLILCEKCEGSSIRSLLLRALSTMCCTTFAVRQFEKFSGIQTVADTLEEVSRPEPERSEAVALLAQVTAPWIEDNHCIKGLQEYSRKMVKSLTKFASMTKCCQNLLLCAAALANLSTMDSKSIKYMLHLETVKVLLDAANRRGPRVSVYLLEQIATLIANMSASEAARKQLVKIQASGALLYFLKASVNGEDVEKRLQQKTIIALSRLCGEHAAAAQLVELGGVEKLVKMCREKEERFDNDAVLVATLATLRKITDTCGTQIISAEDAQEFVEPKLLDSFLAYSTQSESYV